MEPGWTALPSVILERQRALGLEPADVNILLHLIRHWWFKENLPHPSKRAIAECMGVDVSTVRRRIAAMERDGLIKRISRKDPRRGQQTNNYDLSGLIESALPYALESTADREGRDKEEAEKRTRKRPRLRVVNEGGGG